MKFNFRHTMRIVISTILQFPYFLLPYLYLTRLSGSSPNLSHNILCRYFSCAFRFSQISILPFFSASRLKRKFAQYFIVYFLTICVLSVYYLCTFCAFIH